MLKLVDIKKDYLTGDNAVHALKGVRLEFRESEFVAIEGVSGCGKSSLLNIIGGLDQYTSGDLIINGKSTKHFTDGDWDAYRNHSVGFVFQTYNLIPHQSVLQNVELALTLAGVGKKDRRERAMAWLEFVSLADKADMSAGELSYGQQKLLALARIVALRPALLLLDEPTAALSPAMTKKMVELIKRLVAEQKLTTVLIEHNMGVVRELADYIYFLHEGTVHTHGSQKEVLENPAVRELYMGLSGGMAI